MRRIVGDKADHTVGDESEIEPKCFIKSCCWQHRGVIPPFTFSLLSNLPFPSLFFSRPHILPFIRLTSGEEITSSYLALPSIFSPLFPLFLRGLWNAPPPRKQRHNQILPPSCTRVTPSKWLFLLQFINSDFPGGLGKFHINFDQTDVSLPGPPPPLSTLGNSSAQSQAEKTRGKQCK